MTEPLFRDDAYLKSCEAAVVSVNDRGGIVLDRTVFYATSGGQPGDSGVLELADGRAITIATTVKGDSPDQIVHVPAEPVETLKPGAGLVARIDWERRHRLMRMHSACHLLSVACPYPITGASAWPWITSGRICAAGASVGVVVAVDGGFAVELPPESLVALREGLEKVLS